MMIRFFLCFAIILCYLQPNTEAGNYIMVMMGFIDRLENKGRCVLAFFPSMSTFLVFFPSIFSCNVIHFPHPESPE
jgi:hypothetical protein